MGLDIYPTPAWCVHRLLEAVDLPGGRWLEPAVGDGAIVRAVPRVDVQWTTIDIRSEVRPDVVGDFWTMVPPEHRYDVAITNPPYSEAEAFVLAAGQWADIVVMLLRVCWLASARRNEFLRACTPRVLVLPNRPRFVGPGTDLTDYAWFIWGLGAGLEILRTTPREERIQTGEDHENRGYHIRTHNAVPRTGS